MATKVHSVGFCDDKKAPDRLFGITLFIPGIKKKWRKNDIEGATVTLTPDKVATDGSYKQVRAEVLFTAGPKQQQSSAGPKAKLIYYFTKMPSNVRSARYEVLTEDKLGIRRDAVVRLELEKADTAKWDPVAHELVGDSEINATRQFHYHLSANKSQECVNEHCACHDDEEEEEQQQDMENGQ